MMASGAAIVEASAAGASSRASRSPPTCWRPRSPTSSSTRGALHHRRHRPRHRHHGARRAAAHGDRRCPTDVPPDARRQPRLRVRAPRPSRTAATSPRSRSIPRPASSRSCATPWSTISACSINPLMVEGQAHGGVVQGIGQALMERVVYDEDGQLADRLASWTTPCRAPTTRRISASTATRSPATTNPLGAKGCGEAGCAGVAAGGDERAGRCAVARSASATSTCRRRRSASGGRSPRRRRPDPSRSGRPGGPADVSAPAA